MSNITTTMLICRPDYTDQLSEVSAALSLFLCMSFLISSSFYCTDMPSTQWASQHCWHPRGLTTQYCWWCVAVWQTPSHRGSSTTCWTEVVCCACVRTSSTWCCPHSRRQKCVRGSWCSSPTRGGSKCAWCTTYSAIRPHQLAPGSPHVSPGTRSHLRLVQGTQIVQLLVTVKASLHYDTRFRN